MTDSIADDILAQYGIETSSELKHYGVPGMKWGKRKGDSSSSGKSKRQHSDDHVVSRELKAKKRSEMSNAELKKLNERLQLEKSNNELQSRTALQKIKQGTAIAGSILAVGTTINAAVQFTKSDAGKAIIGAVKDAIK